MSEMLDTIESAIKSVSGFEDLLIVWEDSLGVPFGDQSTKFPYITVANEKPSVELATTCGSRVVYPVSICIRYTSTEASKSKARESELKGYEAKGRKIVYAIGEAQSNGTTACEIEEDSISQRSSSGSLTNVIEVTTSFNLAFDEGSV